MANSIKLIVKSGMKVLLTGNPESNTWNPESKTVFGSFTWDVPLERTRDV